MSTFVLSLDIGRSVQEVFSFLADSENTPIWYEAVRSVRKLTPGPVREGARYEMVRHLPQGVVQNEVVVSELETNERVTLRSLSGPTPFTYRYLLEPKGKHTHLTLEGEITGEGLTGPAALLAPLAGAFFKRGMATNLEALRRHLEAV